MYESIFEYQKGRVNVQDQGFKIRAITLDGRPGVRNLFNDIPVQMCHFHQKQIIRRYITGNPKLPAGIELKVITDTLTYATEKEFTASFMLYSQESQISQKKFKEQSTIPFHLSEVPGTEHFQHYQFIGWKLHLVKTKTRHTQRLCR